MYLYAMRDLLAKEFGPPFVAKNDDVAQRQYAHFMATTPNVVQADYRLHRLAKFDPETGLSEICDEIVNPTIGG